MIVITGATGQYGRLVVENLLERGVPAADIAVAVRTPARAADLAGRGVTVREADYDRPDTLVPAFAGADRLLLVSANGPDDLRIAQHRAAAAAAKEAGVGLLAYTSLFDAARSPLSLARVHRASEEAVTATGLPSVLLRNGWYTENYTAALAGAVERGAIVGSAGRGRIASAARADFAEAAAVVLTGDDHVGKVYELTGDTAWSLPELAAEVSLQSGREVVYTDLPADRYAEILLGAGLPGFLVETIVDADVHVSRGALEPVTGDLAALLGRPATPLATSVGIALKG
ncbi:NAD(P)H dehydrogenase (quinone) [Streptosporangium becharense]|uniref:NAD(P)H dehydrogenase (Quinone) n=1 Tax=Streptosporangium becharense TaxID=1816182 RepID=A0A7W9MES0_9ACTN|nr:SDR family oxidoreductase [Streptosporangium becharense]MBB2910833.1 NAD(P)H dehydrogenase (quinone) [Streptosporangium becharense]MBB5817528.1 NAD(P)H dehydrogenase (quinone) [Streptosporangium becharense]